MAPVSLSLEAEYQRGYGPLLDGFRKVDFDDIDQLKNAINNCTAAILVEPIPVSYTHLTLPTNREV